MSYKLKNTGGTIQIGGLQDLNGDLVDIAANKAAIQAVWKDADGNAKGGISIAENAGDVYDCLLTIHGTDITGAIAETAWRTPYNTAVFEVVDGSIFNVGDDIFIAEINQKLTITAIEGNLITTNREQSINAMADGQTVRLLGLFTNISGNEGYYDTDDTEIEVDDASIFLVNDTAETTLGEVITITGITDNVLTITRGASPENIPFGSALTVTSRTTTIAAGNSWDDYSTRTSFNVTNASTFRVDDTIQAVGSDEVMTVTRVDTANNVLTVVRGDVPEDLADDDVLTITNRRNNLPLGTHTIRLESSSDAIVPRNIVIDVVSEAAYNQMVYGKGSGFTQRG